MAQKQQSQPMSEDTKAIITVLLLLFFPPIGFILMWFWTNWPKWVKALVSAPLILFMLAIFATLMLIIINPVGQVKKAQELQCKQECIDNPESAACIDQCLQQLIPPSPMQ